MKNPFICLSVIAAMIFMTGCGGSSSNSESSEKCSSGVFRCDGSMLQKCINETWKNYMECQAGERCNAEKGECEAENSDDNGNSQECTVGEFKCVGDDSYYCDRGNSLVFDSSCENGCDSSTGECREDSTEPTDPTNPTEPSEPTDEPTNDSNLTCAEIIECQNQCDSVDCTKDCYARGTSEAQNDFVERNQKCPTYTELDDLKHCQELYVKCGIKGDETYETPYGHAVIDGSFSYINEAGTTSFSQGMVIGTFVTGNFGSNGSIPDPKATGNASFALAILNQAGDRLILHQTYNTNAVTEKTPNVEFIIDAHSPGTYSVGLSNKDNIQMYVSENIYNEAGACDHAFGYGFVELSGTGLAENYPTGDYTITIKGEVDLYSYKNAPMYVGSSNTGDITNANLVACEYKYCDNYSSWNGSRCVSPCDEDPCEGIANSTGVCDATSATTYSCGCDTNYKWNASNKKCDAATKTASCTGLPANAEWNTATSITQTWNGSSWTPTTAGMYSESSSTSRCYFKCSSGYEWNGSTCQSNSSGGSKSLGEICTGQTSCYNASSSMTCPSSSSADFYGQDAQYTSKCTAQSFSSSTNVVVDNNTGLTWEKSPSSSTYTWANRATHCNELNSSNYGGKSNWRVPNPLELLTIVDNSRYNPATNSNFTNMPSDSSVWFWTSAEYKGDTSYAYAFKPYFGNYYGYDNSSYSKTNTYKVLCVSGDEMQPATSADFTAQTISGKVVVTDSKTGLMWQKEYETDKTWQQALKYCEDSTYAGYSDWRLPNKNELSSLVNYEKSGWPYSNFPDMPSSYFWSSSTLSDYTDIAWNVYFYYGYVGSSYKTSSYNVRCVR